MTFSEALDILSTSPEQIDFHVVVACSFTPLHIQTFVAAHLQQRLPERKVSVETGLFGDLAGTLRRCANKRTDAVAILIEWPDLDPRLGYRTLGGWGVAHEDDILDQVATRLNEFRALIEIVGQEHRTAVSLPTLPFPPAFNVPRWQVGQTETALDALLDGFAAELSLKQNLLFINRRFLDLQSPFGERFDLKSYIQSGLPYKLNHASQVGESFARLLIQRTPKKGLITDLDGTLWRGIVGDIGVNAICWDIHGAGQIHGLYQQTLRALGDQGVFIGIASKNEAAVVHEALRRSDLIVNSDAVFPVEANWQRKSFSVVVQFEIPDGLDYLVFSRATRTRASRHSWISSNSDAMR